MQIFKELKPNKNISVALGFFDGVHLGHRAVIKSAVDYAKQNNTKSAVITFYDHPCCYFWGVCPKYILTRKEREKRIKSLGVDYIYELDFESLSGLTGQEYLKDVLINYFTPVSISTGWNHNFGANKSGNAKFLRENSKKYGYEYFEIPPQKLGNEIINSTGIRKLISEGRTEKANSMLGDDFSVSGKVTEGNKIGRTIGFKTANINYPPELIELPYGAYGVETNFGKGVANFGIRPTINGSNAVLEVHILNFDEDIYGKNLNVKFEKMIRPEKKFSSLSQLKKQIQKDIETIKQKKDTL